jgi:hypothetical protein
MLLQGRNKLRMNRSSLRLLLLTAGLLFAVLIAHVKKSVQKGFSNASELEGDKSLDGRREEAGFKRILEELKAKK